MAEKFWKFRSEFGTTEYQSYSAYHDRVIKRPVRTIEKASKHKCSRPRTERRKRIATVKKYDMLVPIFARRTFDRFES